MTFFIPKLPKTNEKVLLGIGNLFLILGYLLWSGQAQAGPIAERLTQFPNWSNKPPVQAVVKNEDLIYPDWMEGTWNVTSTLVDLVAPLAPDIVTPGFESNRQYLNKPITFPVRFVKEKISYFGFPIGTQNSAFSTQKVVADRAFNGLNIGRATLGDRAILSVRTDPDNPNRQITLLRGNLQLISLVTSRASETPNPEEFIATEITQQLFSDSDRVYLNEVETTTAYHRTEKSDLPIVADQITAIYLSPQDPDYFAAAGKPISLYRYRLEFYSPAK